MDAVGAFAVHAVGDGSYRLALRAPGAHRVEISGDFTGWRAVPLERGNDGQWTLTLPLAFGTHRMNARIDGGQWIVPPGLTTMSDDFSGEVGLLVIERPPAQEDSTK
jgi:1,4-alpha-glucan branching enzyme